MQIPMNNLIAWLNRQIYANEQNKKQGGFDEEVGQILGYDREH